MIRPDHELFAPDIYIPVCPRRHRALQLCNIATLARNASRNVLAWIMAGGSSTPAISGTQAVLRALHAIIASDGIQCALWSGAGHHHGIQLETWRCSGHCPPWSRAL